MERQLVQVRTQRLSSACVQPWKQDLQELWAHQMTITCTRCGERPCSKKRKLCNVCIWLVDRAPVLQAVEAAGVKSMDINEAAKLLPTKPEYT